MSNSLKYNQFKWLPIQDKLKKERKKQDAQKNKKITSFNEEVKSRKKNTQKI
jgi:hypothetical protein